MNQRVIRGCVVPHQVHCRPVFLAIAVIEREPGEVLELLRQMRMPRHRALAVVIADLCARAARTGMREKREVFAFFDPEFFDCSAFTVKAPNSTK